LLEALKTGNDNIFSYIADLVSHESLKAVTKLEIRSGFNDSVLVDHLGTLLLSGNLKKLTVSDQSLTDERVIELVNFLTQKSKLRILELPHGGYTNRSVTQLSTLVGGGCSLSELSVCCNDDEGLIVFMKSISVNVSLNTLSINIPLPLHDDTINRFITSLEGNQSILTLSLFGCGIIGEQWKLIFDSIQRLKHIRSLSLKLTIPNLNFLCQFIASNTSLKSLSINLIYLNGLEKMNIAHESDASIAQAIASNSSCALEELEGVNLKAAAARKALKLDKLFRSKSNKSILMYIKEMRGSGVTTVRRTKLIFAGNGEVGKSTLIRRIRDGTFEENSQIMTDGIDISYFNIKDVEMSVFDFAGQPEYEHTHSLFFDKNSIYLLLYSPRAGGLERLKNYEQMILNSVPNATIIFVTTRADEARLSTDEVESILDACPNICAYVPVDSKSGTWITELQTVIVDLALKKENTVKSIPSSFDKFRQSLRTFGSSRFNISYEEIRALCTSKLDIKGTMIDLALELFLSWGYIFKLSNGDYVLQPQQLADVMSCVFTKLESTKSRIGDVREGVLRHTNEVLDAVWSLKFPDLAKSMWRCTPDEPLSPFIALLYQAGLAFELFDSRSKAINASLVPGLLPLHPCGFQRISPNRSYIDRLCELFIPPSFFPNQIHPRLTISFKGALPTAFVGRLQVKLRRMATLGGAWKRGCCLVLQEVDSKTSEIPGPQTTVQAKVSSLVIIYQPRDELFEIISAGEDTSARSTALSIMVSLIQQQFPCVSIDNVKLTYKGREYGQDDIQDNFPQGFIHHRPTNENIGVGSLRILFPDLPTLVAPPSHQLTSAVTSSLSFLDETNPILPLCPISSIEKFKDLERFVIELEVRGELDDDGEYVFLSDKLFGCIPNILQLMGLKHSKRRGLSTLWIVGGIKDSRFNSSFQTFPPDVTLDRLFALPLSPTRVQGEEQSYLSPTPLTPPSGNDNWYPLVEEGKVDLTPPDESPSNWEEWMNQATSFLIERTLKLIEVPFPNKFKFKPYFNVSDSLSQLRQIEMRYFQDLDGVMLMKSYFISSHGESGISCSSSYTDDMPLGMLLSKQLIKVSENSQAQERVLGKVVQQNQETIQILQRVEKAVDKLSVGLKEGFLGISRELSQTNQEGLSELKELWVKKMSEVERIVEVGGANSTKLLEKEMKKLDVMLTAKLIDMDINSDGITQELKQIRKTLVDTNERRLKGESTSEAKLNTILTDLKSLHQQLDRVEQLSLQIFTGMETGFAIARQELLTSRNSEGLMELKELWLKKMSDLEKTLSGSCTEDVFDKQMKKIEVMLNAKLVDLDLNLSNMSPQLKEIKQQMRDVLTASRQGETKAEQRMGAMMTELKGLQTQLVEVIQLQAESAQNLNQVCVPFLLVALFERLSPILLHSGPCYVKELHCQY
jgi:GTPase SAR1 family protein